jgi:hypothetical protein
VELDDQSCALRLGQFVPHLARPCMRSRGLTCDSAARRFAISEDISFGIHEMSSVRSLGPFCE